jgi:hypothetical protein
VKRERARERRREAGAVFLTVWGVAIFPNALEVFGIAPDGWGWTALRVVLSVAWAVALIVFVVRIVQELRARRA